jgi:cellulose synthase/poly-beta-1,6-N-acetylglucosamine synthase-like glycosyltransferase
VFDLLHFVFTSVATLMVFIAMVPVAAAVVQFVLVACSSFSTHLDEVKDYTPRISVLVPAWNEGAVIGVTIDRLAALNYPREKLRIYVVDDASSDQTPDVVIHRNKLYPGRVFHIRRVAGGEGKAHTLNYGLATLLRTEWTEAVLIMDADVVYSPDSLGKMARHLADPLTGAVTAYIKEGSRAPNYLQRFIAFEYVTATGASRRSQNVLGFLACLSGGAQLHSRENLIAIGGKIFDDTLAEDTFTTFRTQLNGRKAIFEPNALVYAEEPDDLLGLWKQRVRWGRGNVQITRVFSSLWFRGKNGPLGSVAMGILWFSIFLMPLFQIGSALALIALYHLDAPLSWSLFRVTWILSSVVYLFVTLSSMAIDWESCRKSWREGVLFPGLISCATIAFSLVPRPFELMIDRLHLPLTAYSGGIQFMYAWLALSMLVSWLAKEAEIRPRWRWASRPLLYLGGYGAFLCAVTLASYIKELSGAARTWDKTIKTGKVG